MPCHVGPAITAALATLCLCETLSLEFILSTLSDLGAKLDQLHQELDRHASAGTVLNSFCFLEILRSKFVFDCVYKCLLKYT